MKLWATLSGCTFEGAHLGAEDDRSDLAVGLGHGGRQAHEVVLTDGHDLHGEGVLVVVLCCVCVVRHELPVVPELGRHDALQQQATPSATRRQRLAWQPLCLPVCADSTTGCCAGGMAGSGLCFASSSGDGTWHSDMQEQRQHKRLSRWHEHAV